LKLSFDSTVKPLCEFVDPPIILPFPEAEPQENIPEWLEYCEQQIADAGFCLEPCEHLSDREYLHWIHRLLQEEIPVENPGNVIMEPESCPDCWRQATENMIEEPLRETEKMLRRTKEFLGEAKYALENNDNYGGEFIWPPGGDRFLQMISVIIRRLEKDIEEDRIPLLEGSQEAAFAVMSGLEALLWFLTAIRKFADQETYLAYDCFKGGTRMARILAKKPPDDHPARFYKDIGYLVPDAEFYTNIIYSEWLERDESLPVLPEGEQDNGPGWAKYFYELSSKSEPFFKVVLESSVSKKRLRGLHKNWKIRQQNIKLQNKRDEMISKQVLHYSLKFDSEMPDEFFNRESNYREFFQDKLEEMDPETAGLAVVLSQVEDSWSSEDFWPEEDEVFYEGENEEQKSPLQVKLSRLKERLLKDFGVDKYDDVEPLSVVLIFLVDLAQEWVEGYPDYYGLSKTDSARRGAYLLTEHCAERAIEWLNLSAQDSGRRAFEEIVELAQANLKPK